MTDGDRIRVLVVDDSAAVRRAIAAALAQHGRIDVVGRAADPYEARELLAAERPDVITLDLDMPGMSGLQFVEKLMHHCPVPTVVVSSLATHGSQVALDALLAGAVGVLEKPRPGSDLAAWRQALVDSVLAAAHADVSTVLRSSSVGSIQYSDAGRPRPLVAVGASTGGVTVVEQIIRALPASAPALAVAQHMPSPVVHSFAKRLAAHARLRVRVARDGEPIVRGNVYLAPGDHHLTVARRGGQLVTRLAEPTRADHCVPSIDRLMTSVAQHVGDAAIGVILTGMGSDGARGLLAMRRNGAYTCVQTARTCAVPGMPRAAQAASAVDHELDVGQIVERLQQACTTSDSSALCGGRPWP